MATTSSGCSRGLCGSIGWGISVYLFVLARHTCFPSVKFVGSPPAISFTVTGSPRSRSHAHLRIHLYPHILSTWREVVGIVTAGQNFDFSWKANSVFPAVERDHMCFHRRFCPRDAWYRVVSLPTIPLPITNNQQPQLLLQLLL